MKFVVTRIQGWWGKGSQGRWRERELGEDGQKVQSSSYQINNVIYNMINVVTLLYIIHNSF